MNKSIRLMEVIVSEFEADDALEKVDSAGAEELTEENEEKFLRK